ncbi:MAG: zinc ribbon domain-containing protein [Planctomycetes bacterium]|nr:zinc ribbon domain-containing protein [Planctomycetota bacterium]
MPEPVGMVLNVLVVSAAIVLVRVAWLGAVVFRRRRKGLCVKCGYPIEASAPRCPECGSAYPASAVQSRA